MTPPLPLRWATPAGWAAGVFQSPLELLSDHAHLERKATSNALDLFNRGGDGEWFRCLGVIIREEARHLELVLRHLAQRGGTLQRFHHNRYAGDLRAVVRAGRNREELVDRLLVSALIEARSCERFTRLAAECPDGELARFYRFLVASEAGHHDIFLGLALRVDPGAAGRWNELLDVEARLIQAQAPGPRVHSGLAGPAQNR